MLKSPRSLLCWLSLVWTTVAARSLSEIDEYLVFPQRSMEEAVVLEWGFSAIISALDGSAATFGPQTSQAALMEVETMPILAQPADGVLSDEEATVLDNAEEIFGNMCVMTNAGGLSGVQMATLAQNSGAAALLVVNVDKSRPDDIYRLEPLEGEDASHIDIPVVMISLNSANVLTTTGKVNNGMPDRVRMYAGGDRPFFEDLESRDPTIYLIHNILTSEECDNLVKRAKSKVQPITKEDPLQMTTDVSKFVNIERVMLWQGMLQGPGSKALEERIEQVTGFPTAHFSDFIVDKFEKGSHWKPRYDGFAVPPFASVHVFLTDVEGGGEFVYPNTKSGDPIKILPAKGMAVIHHNTNDRSRFDMHSLHAILPVEEGTMYVATKYIFAEPIPNARRIALPAIALPFGGRLPWFMLSLHEYILEKFGPEDGEQYFNKACVFLPLLFVFALVQVGFEQVQRQMERSKTRARESAKKKN